ncbi:hypothetical protein P3T29_000017 [Kitasatospora sp. MAP5-34]|nr:hypothetical protein [Kitasatospora sp. MAP5-34]
MYREGGIGTEVVAAARAGDEEARDRLIAGYLPLVYNVVGRAMNGRPDVDDVVQETMIRLGRAHPRVGRSRDGGVSPPGRCPGCTAGAEGAGGPRRPRDHRCEEGWPVLLSGARCVMRAMVGALRDRAAVGMRRVCLPSVLRRRPGRPVDHRRLWAP